MTEKHDQFKKAIDAKSAEELRQLLDDMAFQLDRQLGENAGTRWAIKEITKDQLAALVGDVLWSNPGLPGQGDAVDYVRACNIGPHGSVMAALMDLVGVTDPEDFVGGEEEFFKTEENAISFIRGVMKVWYRVTDGDPL